MKVSTKFEFGIIVGGVKISWDKDEIFDVERTYYNARGVKVYQVQKNGVKFELAAYEVIEI